MTRIFATLIGMTLAAGLVLANPSDEPMELAVRYLEATDETAIAATWKNWHPEAVHTVTIKYGLGLPDEQFSYPASDWETLPDWRQDTTLKDAMQGYTEATRSASRLTSETDEDGTHVTAVTRVGYIWGDTPGTMIQTDKFFVVSQAGRLVIRALDTTFDYR
ncbi:hypothetical protein [Ruegeria sp. EL01]|jgi:hypothetical protein|uniref:hypothetical protein n=1 Tax=Ruegeria sp. EL01 TaxID=2107578 RepID=UPI000EA82A6D|nr:hypothetical protein [Ruegeria sp. EL01]